MVRGTMRLTQQHWSFFSGFLLASSLYTLYSVMTMSKNDASKRKRVLLFGDSITQHGWNVQIHGWAAQFAHHWFRRVDILNRGYSGYNSRWGLSLLESVVIKEQPDLVTVFFGANDAVDPSVLQHVPLNEYESNMMTIVSQIKARLPNVPLIVITPPPVWEATLEEMNRIKQKPLLLDRTNQRTYSYAQICKKVSLIHNVPYVDLWEGLEGSSEARQQYLSDGLHLSAKGNDKLFEMLQEVIYLSFPAWRLENMQLDQPEWAAMGEIFRQKQRKG